MSEPNELPEPKDFDKMQAYLIALIALALIGAVMSIIWCLKFGAYLLNHFEF